MSVDESHSYEVEISWTGNRGEGTRSYRGYSRDHTIAFPGKPVLHGSSDPAFRGDPARYNPEELLVASLSACQMLWYLHLCAEAGIVVATYRDPARGTMGGTDGDLRFTEVRLSPVVGIVAGDPRVAAELHRRAHEKCFIARSVNFPVVCDPTIEVIQESEVPEAV